MFFFSKKTQKPHFKATSYNKKYQPPKIPHLNFSPYRATPHATHTCQPACCMMPPHANNVCCTSSLHIIRYKPRLSPYLAQYTLMGARYHPMRPWCQIVQVKVLTIIQGIIIVSNNSIILPININIRPFFFFISQLQRYFFLSINNNTSFTYQSKQQFLYFFYSIFPFTLHLKG